MSHKILLTNYDAYFMTHFLHKNFFWTIKIVKDLFEFYDSYSMSHMVHNLLFASEGNWPLYNNTVNKFEIFILFLIQQRNEHSKTIPTHYVKHKYYFSITWCKKLVSGWVFVTIYNPSWPVITCVLMAAAF